MIQDAFTPDAHFFNEDGSINYREALAAGSVARADAVRQMMTPTPKEPKPSFAARIAAVFSPAGATA